MASALRGYLQGETPVHQIIYIIGLIVVIMAVLSLLGLR